MHCELDRALPAPFLGPKACDTAENNIITFTNILSKLISRIPSTREIHLATCENVLLLVWLSI